MGRMRARPKVDEARDILANVVVCHVPVVHYNFQQKVQLGSTSNFLQHPDVFAATSGTCHELLLACRKRIMCYGSTCALSSCC